MKKAILALCLLLSAPAWGHEVPTACENAAKLAYLTWQECHEAPSRMVCPQPVCPECPALVAPSYMVPCKWKPGGYVCSSRRFLLPAND